MRKLVYAQIIANIPPTVLEVGKFEVGVFEVEGLKSKVWNLRLGFLRTPLVLGLGAGRCRAFQKPLAFILFNFHILTSNRFPSICKLSTANCVT